MHANSNIWSNSLITRIGNFCSYLVHAAPWEINESFPYLGNYNKARLVIFVRFVCPERYLIASRVY